MKKPAQAVERATLRREKIGYADYLIVDPGLVPALNNFYRNYELSRASLSSGLG